MQKFAIACLILVLFAGCIFLQPSTGQTSPSPKINPTPATGQAGSGITPPQPASNSQISTPDTINAQTFESKIHEQINQKRAENGFSQIGFNPKLADIARLHSQDMAGRGYFAHETPDGHNFDYRYAQAGFTCQITIGTTIYEGAENLFQAWTFGKIYYTNGVETRRDYYSEDELARAVVDGWMNSPGHRKNILTPYWETEGMGVFIAQDGKVFVTENFC